MRGLRVLIRIQVTVDAGYMKKIGLCHENKPKFRVLIICPCPTNFCDAPLGGARWYSLKKTNLFLFGYT